MNRAFIAVLCAMLVGCALALQLPDVKDQTDKPIDPKQIKNATLTFYNNGTYIYMLEVPCEAYLGGRGGSQQRSQQRSQSSGSNAHDEEDDEHEDDEDANGSSQMTAQQRQRQQQQQQQRQQQQSGRSSRQTAGGSQADHHMNPDELRQAHEGTECECKCKNQEGEELEDIITVTMGGKGGSQQSSSSQRGGQRSQQQRQQQQRQQQQRQQRASGAGGASSHGHEEGEGPELVYPTQPRPGQKCIFFEEGEWENDDDELIGAVGPDDKTPGEPDDEVLEKCTFNFKKGGASQQQQSSSQGAQQASLQCVDSHGEKDQYVVRIVNGELKPKLTPQQKQESQKSKSQKSPQQGRNRSQ